MAITEVTMRFPATREGIDHAAAELERLRALVSDTPDPDQPEDTIVTVYRRAGSGSRTRELLEILPAPPGFLPAELATKLKPDRAGEPLSKASVRAVLRNLQRLEGHLSNEGLTRRRVLLIDWTNYDAEGAGRYAISAEDRERLRQYLADEERSTG